MAVIPKRLELEEAHDILQSIHLRSEGFSVIVAVNRETRRRVPASNLQELKVPRGKTIFEATDGGKVVDAIVYNVRTGQVLLGRAQTHQELIDRYAPTTSIDDYVRDDLFVAQQRLEFDSFRAAVEVDRFGRPEDRVQAWNNIHDAREAFIQMGLSDAWEIQIDGEKV